MTSGTKATHKVGYWSRNI